MEADPPFIMAPVDALVPASIGSIFIVCIGCLFAYRKRLMIAG
jgi:hypothetical protein